VIKIKLDHVKTTTSQLAVRLTLPHASMIYLNAICMYVPAAHTIEVLSLFFRAISVVLVFLK
jgi:hypothetical protein